MPHKKQTRLDTKNEQLKKALSSGNPSAIKKLIDEALDSDFSSAEKGEILTNLAYSYLQMTNEVQAAYLETLEASIQSLQKVDADDKNAKEYLKIEKVRRKLQEIDDLD